MRHRIESHMVSVNEMARKDGVHLVNNVPFRPRAEAQGRVISDEITEDAVMSFDGAVGFALVEPDEPFAMIKALDPAIPLHITSESLRKPRAQSLEADLSGMFKFGDEDSAATPADDGESEKPAADPAPETPETPSDTPAEPEVMELTEESNARTVEALREQMKDMTVKELKALAADMNIDLGGARNKADIFEAIVTAP